MGRLFSFLVALTLVVGIIAASAIKLTSVAGWEAVWEYRLLLIQGWWLTVGLSLASLFGSTILGMLLALGRRCRWAPVRDICRIYVEMIRGTPLLVQILILYYGVFDQVGLENRFVAGVLILSGFSGAYISEIIRAGIESIGKSQIESARAIGFTTAQTYRYVIFPQALRQSLPPIAGQFASLVKDSSLLSIIALAEFTQCAQQVASFTFSQLESYFPLAIGYLVLTLPISLWTQSLEKKLKFET
jgi:polar amino acid transport system permease protein